MMCALHFSFSRIFFCAHFDHPTIITCEKAVYVYTQLCIINHAAYVYGSNIYGGNRLALWLISVSIPVKIPRTRLINACLQSSPCYSFLYRLLDSWPTLLWQAIDKNFRTGILFFNRVHLQLLIGGCFCFTLRRHQIGMVEGGLQGTFICVIDQPSSLLSSQLHCSPFKHSIFLLDALWKLSSTGFSIPSQAK